MSGRTSKLTDRQWGDIGRRLALGETASSLAKEFGVGKSRISERFRNRLDDLKSLAKEVVTVDEKVKVLPISEQCSVITLADHLRNVGNNLAEAASTNSRISARLAKLAEKEMDLLEKAPNLQRLPQVAMLTEVSNKAATIGVSFVSANKPKAGQDGPTLEDLVVGKEDK